MLLERIGLRLVDLVTNIAGQVVVARHLGGILSESAVISYALDHVLLVVRGAHPGMPLLELELGDILDARTRRAELDEVVHDAGIDLGERDAGGRRPEGVAGDTDVRIARRAGFARRVQAVQESGQLVRTPPGVADVRYLCKVLGRLVTEVRNDRNPLARSVFLNIPQHGARTHVIVVQVLSDVGIEARNDYTDVSGCVNVALGDSCGDVLARGVQTEKLALYSVSIRPGRLAIDRALDIMERLHTLFDELQLLAFAARGMRAVTLLETLELILFALGGVLQVNAVRLVTRRSVDAVEVTDLLGVSLDHLLFFGVTERRPPLGHFLLGGSLGRQLQILLRDARSLGRPIRVGACSTAQGRELALYVLDDARRLFHDRAHLVGDDLHVLLDRHRICWGHVVRTHVLNGSI